MTAKERREAILQRLIAHPAGEPLNATVLARQFDVSRQIIVGDIALLRSAGEPIVATARGYCYRPGGEADGIRRRIVCNHTAAQMEDELNTIVDFGGKVEDVIIEHPIYGKLTGELRLACRYDVRQFCEKVAGADAKPLSALTEGIHTHTVRFPDEESYVRLCQALSEKGVLLSCD